LKLPDPALPRCDLRIDEITHETADITPH
jgi:hypothetical protein